MKWLLHKTQTNLIYFLSLSLFLSLSFSLSLSPGFKNRRTCQEMTTMLRIKIPLEIATLGDEKKGGRKTNFPKRRANSQKKHPKKIINAMFLHDRSNNMWCCCWRCCCCCCLVVSAAAAVVVAAVAVVAVIVVAALLVAAAVVVVVLLLLLLQPHQGLWKESVLVAVLLKIDAPPPSDLMLVLRSNAYLFTYSQNSVFPFFPFIGFPYLFFFFFRCPPP